VGIGVAQRGGAEAACDRGEQRDLVVAAHPTGHPELLEPRLDAEGLELFDGSLHGRPVRRRAGEASAEVVAEAREIVVAGGVGNRVGVDRVLDLLVGLGAQRRGQQEGGEQGLQHDD